jgi:translation initiation factor IF-2
MAGKVLRLSKVAKELNVGIATLVDFFQVKVLRLIPIQIPNLRITLWKILFNQFAADQSVKEKSKQASMVKERKKETISLRDSARKRRC